MAPGKYAGLIEMLLPGQANATEFRPRHRDTRLLTEGPYAGNYVHTAAMVYTVGVMVSDGKGNPVCRWCYNTYTEAQRALSAWAGRGDPPGNWIKYKGRDGERTRWEPLGVHGWPVKDTLQ